MKGPKNYPDFVDNEGSVHLVLPKFGLPVLCAIWSSTRYRETTLLAAANVLVGCLGLTMVLASIAAFFFLGWTVAVLMLFAGVLSGQLARNKALTILGDKALVDPEFFTFAHRRLFGSHYAWEDDRNCNRWDLVKALAGLIQILAVMRLVLTIADMFTGTTSVPAAIMGRYNELWDVLIVPVILLVYFLIDSHKRPKSN